jgi:ABC-type phosphate transport system substrate-binding protein
MKICCAVALLLVVVVLPSVQAVSAVYELHGIGTSNPCKCFWSIMETLREQSDVPLHLTYRSFGTTQGIAEFTAMFSSSNAATNNFVTTFASGDIPLTTADYVKTTTDGTATGSSQMYHLPVLIGAISFFHSVPDVVDLRLNACLLSQIYQLKITSWGDDQIVALNPNMSSTARATNIIVAHRAEGSSTAYSSAEVCVCMCVFVVHCCCRVRIVFFLVDDVLVVDDDLIILLLMHTHNTRTHTTASLRFLL